MSDDDLIFEKKLSTNQVDQLRATFEKEGSFEIEFVVDNDKIRFSHTPSEVSPRHIADAIVEAVQQWPVEHVSYKPRTVPSLELGQKRVTYTRLVALDWKTRKIRTSLGPNDGKLFLKVLAYFVEMFRASTATTTPTPKEAN